MSQADFFLKIEGIDGESEDSKHKGEIEILSWSFGATNSGGMSYGGGGGTGKVSMNDISFSKRYDKSSPKLLLHCCNGKHLTKMVFVARKQGEEQLEYLKITLTDVLVTSYQASAGGADASDSFSVDFAKIEQEFTPQQATGTGGGKVPMHWSVKENKGG